ncbi:MAG: D-glycero-beta-D-manno-heptose 1-phosphate adenylyltransferase [Lachnospiraceae bacterium]|nr:D-glycero-beta-D-manno-heptose 1-phosphate adenylyltransferase [Lachnospiraceae bacterium]
MRRNTRNKIITQKQLGEEIQRARQQGKTVVSTSGCFDILHAGHVTYLEEAKARGDILVVLLNADSSVRALKGSTRPIVPEMERAVVIAGLESVDYVCIFSEQTPCAIIDSLQPDVVIKGGDYAGKQIPEMDSVAAYGGRVEYVDVVDGCSTTNIVEKIRRMMEELS